MIRSQSEKFGYVPVKVVYHCEEGCKPTRDVREHNDSSPEKRSYFEKYDLGKVREIESKEIPHWYPHHRMMNMTDDCSRGSEMRWTDYGMSEPWLDLFTKRNLWALSSIRDAINKVEDESVRDALMFGLTGLLLNSSKMYQGARGGSMASPTGRTIIPQVFKRNGCH